MEWIAIVTIVTMTLSGEVIATEHREWKNLPDKAVCAEVLSGKLEITKAEILARDKVSGRKIRLEGVCGFVPPVTAIA